MKMVDVHLRLDQDTVSALDSLVRARQCELTQAHRLTPRTIERAITRSTTVIELIRQKPIPEVA